MPYIDGIVVPVPAANRQAYIDYANKMAAVMKEAGALRVVDGWGDDVPEGKLTSFTLAVQRKDDEVTVFSWVEWPSREVRDAAWRKLESDPRMDPKVNPMPFDGRRMIYGGFASIVDAR